MSSGTIRSTGIVTSGSPGRVIVRCQMPGCPLNAKPALSHGLGEQRCVGEAAGVERQVGVGGEGLVSREAVEGLEVDGLRADEDERVEVRLEPGECVE